MIHEKSFVCEFLLPTHNLWEKQWSIYTNNAEEQVRAFEGLTNQMLARGPTPKPPLPGGERSATSCSSLP
jgi:hypothetical protein